MKNLIMRTSMSVCLIALFLFVGSLLAQDVHLMIKKAGTAPVIDGEMDAIWSEVEAETEFNVIGEDNRENEMDCSPSFRVLWDENYIYYYVEVLDEFLNVDESLADLTNPDGGWGWADDVVEIYLDGDNSKEADWANELDASQLWWAPDFPHILYYQTARLHMDTTNIVYAQKLREADDGWNLEVAIPLADAGIAAEAGTIFGFEFDAGDDDGVPFAWRADGPGGRETKLKWFGTEDVTEPVHWANAQLSDEVVGQQGDVHLHILKTTKAPVIDGEMDDIWAGVTAEAEFNVVGEDNRENEMDCTPSFRVMWDETYLYYYVEVLDEFLNVDESLADLTNPDGGWGWADDVVEIYLDGDNSKEDDWANELDGSQIWWAPDFPHILYFKTTQLNMDTTNILYAQKLRDADDGWNLEVAIPLADAGITAQAGTIFGFEFDVGDDDGVPFAWRADGPGGRETKMKWFGTEDKTEPVHWANAQLSASEVTTSIESFDNIQVTRAFELTQNYPNPFNPATQIAYVIPAKATVKLAVYDVLGHEIAMLVSEVQDAGRYAVSFNAANLTSGVYFYKLTYHHETLTKKMMYMK